MSDEKIISTADIALAFRERNFDVLGEYAQQYPELINQYANNYLPNRSLVCNAVDNNDADMVSFLLFECNATPLREFLGKSSLHRASANGNLDIVKLLVQKAKEMHCLDLLLTQRQMLSSQHKAAEIALLEDKLEIAIFLTNEELALATIKDVKVFSFLEQYLYVLSKKIADNKNQNTQAPELEIDIKEIQKIIKKMIDRIDTQLLDNNSVNFYRIVHILMRFPGNSELLSAWQQKFSAQITLRNFSQAENKLLNFLEWHVPRNIVYVLQALNDKDPVRISAALRGDWDEKDAVELKSLLEQAGFGSAYDQATIISIRPLTGNEDTLSYALATHLSQPLEIVRTLVRNKDQDGIIELMYQKKCGQSNYIVLVKSLEYCNFIIDWSAVTEKHDNLLPFQTRTPEKDSTLARTDSSSTLKTDPGSMSGMLLDFFESTAQNISDLLSSPSSSSSTNSNAPSYDLQMEALSASFSLNPPAGSRTGPG
jgi:hypothetical protein